MIYNKNTDHRAPYAPKLIAACEPLGDEVKTDRGTNDAASSKHDEAKEADAGADDRAVTEPVGAVYDFIDGAAAWPHERPEGHGHYDEIKEEGFLQQDVEKLMPREEQSRGDATPRRHSSPKTDGQVASSSTNVYPRGLSSASIYGCGSDGSTPERGRVDGDDGR